jgi:hypothetical protein
MKNKRLSRQTAIAVIIALTALTVFTGGTETAYASFTGANMRLFFYDPTLGTHLDTRDFVVVHPVEAVGVLGFMNVDVQASKMILTTSLTGSTIGNLPASSFSGFTLFDSGNTLPAITGVSLNANTNIVGLDSSRLSFDANNVFANLSGLNLPANARMEVDVTFDTILLNDNFVGRNMTLFYDDPTLGTHIDTRNFTVTGVEAERILGFLDVDVSASQIAISTRLPANTLASLPARSFSGLNLTDSNGLVNAITGVSISSSSNLSGFDASRLSFDADNVYANLQGLNFRPDTRLVLDVTFAPVVSAAPEPSPFALLALSLGFGLALRRSLQKANLRSAAL